MPTQCVNGEIFRMISVRLLKMPLSNHVENLLVNNIIIVYNKDNITIQIKPVSDLRNKFPEIEKIVNNGEPVYLTKNGYGSMVVLSLESYSRLTQGIETELDKADFAAENDSRRYTHKDVFNGLKRRIND